MRRVLVGILGVAVVVMALAGYAAAASKGLKKRHFTEVVTGASISMKGSSFVSAYKVVSSLDGNGASIQVGSVTGSAFPLSGKSTTTTYFADGVGVAKSTFKLGALDTNGIATITGSGRCVSGTRVHKHEKCTFTISGTYNSKTTVTSVKVAGTDTR